MKWAYFLLTALTFYLLSPGVLVSLPSVGPVPSLAVHALVFTAVHVMLHKVMHK
jgi:hypothetical protein